MNPRRRPLNAPEPPNGDSMNGLARTLALVGVLAASLTACIVISRETVERERPPPAYRYDPPPPPPPAPLR
jgi:hypothetical protein